MLEYASASKGSQLCNSSRFARSAESAGTVHSGNGHVAAEPWHGLVLNVCRTGTGTFSWQLGVCAAGFDR